MSETLEARAKRLGWSKDFTEGVRKVQESAAADTRTKAQRRTEAKQARLGAQERERMSRQAATIASKAKRGI